MIKRMMVMLGGLALAACGSEPEAPKAEAIPAKLPGGTYEVTATVKSLVSTDKTPVPTFAKVGDVLKSQGCVGTDGLPKADLLGAKGDICQVQNPYARNGRMNLTLDCTRKGQGKVMASLDGKFTADSLTGTLTSSSAFAGPGDYKLVQDVVARKVSDQCTAAPAAGAAPGKA